MNYIRLTKEFHFEMAHALDGYDGKCAHIHGHSYALFVTVSGTPIEENGNPKNGMLMDFSDLKDIVKSNIVDIFDHALVLYKDSVLLAQLTGCEAQQVIRTAYNPTCENLLIDFATRIQNLLPGHIKLHALKLVETPNSYAEWFADDQEGR